MIQIYMIITSLALTALAKGSVECNFTESTETKPCFGELGEPLIFYLPTNTNTRKMLKNDNRIIIKLANDSEGSHKDIKDEKRFTFLNNGKLKLNKATKEDSGDYQLETHHLTSGELLYRSAIHLEIRGPVSKPAVSQTCLSPEMMKVSCSSEGDGAEIILFLDNNLLIHSRATEKHIVSNVTVSLYGQLTGNLMCDVHNNVSREQTAIQLTRCSSSGNTLGTVTVAVIATVIAGSILLLFLAVALGIKQKRTPSPVANNNDNTEDEIVYSDVKVSLTPRETAAPRNDDDAT